MPRDTKNSLFLSLVNREHGLGIWIPIAVTAYRIAKRDRWLLFRRDFLTSTPLKVFQTNHVTPIRSSQTLARLSRGFRSLGRSSTASCRQRSPFELSSVCGKSRNAVVRFRRVLQIIVQQIAFFICWEAPQGGKVNRIHHLGHWECAPGSISPLVGGKSVSFHPR